MSRPADKLLSDFPAEVAGTVASKAVNPPEAQVSPGYDNSETESEKRARLQGSALEFQIVREGVQFEFSKLSGVGNIEVSFWKKKPLLVVQGSLAILLFALLLWRARLGVRPLVPVVASLVCLTGAGLTEGFAARLWNPRARRGRGRLRCEHHCLRLREIERESCGCCRPSCRPKGRGGKAEARMAGRTAATRPNHCGARGRSPAARRFRSFSWATR